QDPLEFIAGRIGLCVNSQNPRFLSKLGFNIHGRTLDTQQLADVLNGNPPRIEIAERSSYVYSGICYDEDELTVVVRKGEQIPSDQIAFLIAARLCKESAVLKPFNLVSVLADNNSSLFANIDSWQKPSGSPAISSSGISLLHRYIMALEIRKPIEMGRSVGKILSGIPLSQGHTLVSALKTCSYTKSWWDHCPEDRMTYDLSALYVMAATREFYFGSEEDLQIKSAAETIRSIFDDVPLNILAYLPAAIRKTSERSGAANQNVVSAAKIACELPEKDQPDFLKKTAAAVMWVKDLYSEQVEFVLETADYMLRTGQVSLSRIFDLLIQTAPKFETTPDEMIRSFLVM
ncbi:MAG: hypothetical protein AABZ57_01325, partial [Candidatus Margulisiibacteriota bacterium]